jgi:PPP family 3-phenylpropionic acid transporter
MRRKQRPASPQKPPVLRLSAFYALYFGALGVLVPYWPLYLQKLGFGPGAIGAFMAIVPATKIISPSFWGWLADRAGRPMRYVRWTSFLSALSMGLLLIEPNDPRWMAGILVAFGFFWNGPLPLLETVTLAHLRGRGGYGRIRLWGSIGFIFSVGIGGQLLGSQLSVNALPAIMLGFLVLQWLVTGMIPTVAIHREHHENNSLFGILRRPPVIAFLGAALLIQIAHGPYYAFYSVFLSTHGYTDATIGQLWALGVVAEVLLFLWMDGLERHFGLRALFLLGILISLVRWIMIGWGVDSDALMVLAQVLHAGTFGLLHVASIALVHQHFQGPHHAKGQALYSGFCYGIGGAAGSLYAGYFWQLSSPTWVFTSASVISAVAFLMAWPLVAFRTKHAE